MFGTVGEDYTTPETIKRTGGVVPDGTWELNWRNIQEVARIAAELGIKTVTFHAGFLPHEESDPAFAKLLDRIARIAAVFGAKGISLGFETGQETAETLRSFLEKLGCANVGVNFDPANMILYEKGDPIAARPSGFVYKTWKKLKKHKAAVAVGSFAAKCAVTMTDSAAPVGVLSNTTCHSWSSGAVSTHMPSGCTSGCTCSNRVRSGDTSTTCRNAPCTQSNAVTVDPSGAVRWNVEVAWHPADGQGRIGVPGCSTSR